MTLFNNYSVQYFVSNTWTTIDNLQEVSCTVGRQNITDSWSASQAAFTFRYPTGFASPLAGLNVGTPIRLNSPNSSTGGTWSGYVKDVQVSWGIPYVAGVGQADFLTIQAEGALASWGRKAGTGFTPSSSFANTQLTEVLTHYGFTWNGNLTSEPVEPQTTNTTVLDWFQKFINTVQGRVLDGHPTVVIDDIYQRGNVFVRSNASLIKSTVSFSDVANDATRQVYDKIEFDGLADNTFNQSIVTSPTYSDQISTNGVAPFRSFTTDTYANSAAQAKDIADYVLAEGSGPIAPRSISCVSSAQNVSKLDTLGISRLSFERFMDIPLFYVEIVFRGQTYEARVEGATLTASPEQTRVTYYLSSQESNPFFLLDNADFGVLDQNKLGLYVF
jgi:hypothetical protein